MNIQLGDFSSLFEVGVALNISYALFGQVRNLGQEEVRKSISDLIDEWETDEADETDSAQLKRSKQAAEKTFSKKEKEGAVQTTGLKITTTCCAFVSFIMLFICAVFANSTFNLNWFGGSIFFLFVLLCCLCMPLAIIKMHLFWRKCRNDIKQEIKAYRNFCNVDQAVGVLEKASSKK